MLVAAAPAGATTSGQAVAFLNQQRAANSIPANVALDAYRTTGCHNHDAYMEQNGLRHGETVGDPGYTPEGADYSNSGEVLAQGVVGFTTTSNPWDAAPLHQTLLFDPLVNSAGYDDDGRFACMRFGYDFSQPPMPVLYAFTGDSGRTDVRPSVTVRGERPYAPQEAVGIPQGTPTGPNILFFAEGFGSSDRAVSGSVSMTGPSGPVDVRMVDSTTQAPDGSGPVLPTGGDLIPVKPLEPLATYNVAVTWQGGGGQRVPMTLSFKTAGRSITLTLSLSRKLSRSRRATLTVPAAAVGQTATVTLELAPLHRHPRTVTTRQIVLKRTQRIAVPSGRTKVAVTAPGFAAGDTRYTVKGATRTYR
jgi:hypothetical protein